MITFVSRVVICVVAVCLAPSVLAQDSAPSSDTAPPPNATSTFGEMPMASGESEAQGSDQSQFGVMPMASHGSDKKLERRLSLQRRPKQDRRNRRPAGILALHGGAAIFVGDNIDRDVIKPGGSFAFIGGADFGYGTLEAEVGFTGFPIDLGAAGRDPLKRVHLGLGGRLQLPNASLVTPYLGASFVFQWWKLDAASGCPFLICARGDDFRFAPGINTRAGVTISLGLRAGLDLGLRYNLSFEGNDVFTRTRHWLEPSLGVRIWL